MSETACVTPDPLRGFPSVLLVGVASSVAAKAAGDEPKNRLSRILIRRIERFQAHIFLFPVSWLIWYKLNYFKSNTKKATNYYRFSETGCK